MNKKSLSFIVILCTIFSVVIMLFSDKISLRREFINGKIEVKNDKNSNKDNEIQTNINNDLNSQSTNNEDNKEKKSNYKTEGISTYIDTDNYKSFKMDKINEQMKEDKNVFLAHSDVGEAQNKKTTVVNSENDLKKQSSDEAKKQSSNESKEYTEHTDKSESSSKDEVPVFKVSRSKVKDSLTFSDKEKLLFVASKLSAVDYEKISKYLQNGSDEDIKNTIKLLRERLSDKDYEKVKEVAEKFINMDAIGQ